MQKRREFLKQLFKGAAAATAVAAVAPTGALAEPADDSGVVRGKSKKKEVLYFESEMWKKYYATR